MGRHGSPRRPAVRRDRTGPGPTRGVRRLTSQLYVAGEPLNVDDIALSSVTNPAQRAGLIRPYEDGSAIEPGAQSVSYDLVVMI